MNIALTEQQQAEQQRFRAFAQDRIAPFADAWDQAEDFPREVIAAMAEAGFLGATVPAAQGGTVADYVTMGLLHEQIGRACSSARSLLTVHGMVAHTVARWGGKHHKERYLEALIRGDLLGAFALSEPAVGSDAGSIQTTATPQGEMYVLNGRKKWTTFGQIADLLLVFATSEGKHTAFLVERETPGLSVVPIRNMLGTRASLIAEIHLNDCVVPKTARIGGLGFGIAAIATSALDIGRYSVACGSVGIAQACLDAALRYTSERRQGGGLLKDHQLVRQLVSKMHTNVTAARLLCLQAGYLKDTGHPTTVMETWVAKYFASTSAMQAALDAVQLLGANGCSADYPVARYMRDAKVMEIIEGSTQLQEITIADYAYAQEQA